MKRFRVLDYLKKFQIPIVVLSLLAGVVFYTYMQSKQTYTASAIISYTNSGASEGLAPDGSEIDVTEIYSSQVMTQVFERMSLDQGNYNLDEVRSRVSVQPIVSEEEQAVQEAKNSAGEEVTSKPTKYLVSFTTNNHDSNSPEEFARQVLDTMLDVYIQFYGENHINSLTAPNDISGLQDMNYDYLEMAEILEDSIDSTLSSIYGQYEQNTIFRSSANGYSFSDLYQEFSALKDVELSNVYAYILNNKVTKNKDALLAKYENRIQEFYLNNDASETEIAAINNVIDSYVNMMRESDNTNITYEYIINDIHETQMESQAQTETGTQYTEPVDQTVEYDVLMEDYASNREEYEWSLIEVAYCKYIIEIYSGEASVGTMVELDEFESNSEESDDEDTDGSTNTEKNVEKTDRTTAVSVDAQAVSSEEALQTTSSMLTNLIEKTENLYDILLETNEEYNEYGGAANIGLMSNIVVMANQRILIYALLVVVIFVIILCTVAILLGRLGDIVDYYVYRDRKFELPNRVGCDKFMERYSSQMLPENFCCIVLRLLKVKEKNVRYGRENMDNMMLKFNDIIKNIYPNNDNCFIALNGVGQYIIYSKDMSKEHMEAYAGYLKREVEEFNQIAECKIEYECGMAESKSTSAYRIKLLLINALHNVKPVVTVDE